MRMIRYYCTSLLVVLIIVSVTSCSRDEELILPARRALSDGPEYAVALPAYTRLHESPEIESGVVGHMRRGDVAEILRESEFTDVHADQASRWYEVEADGGVGWIFGDYVSLHETYAQAERVSQRITDLQSGEEAPQ